MLFRSFADPATLRAFAGHRNVSTTMSFYVFPEEHTVRRVLSRIDAEVSGQSLVSLDQYRYEKSIQNIYSDQQGAGANKKPRINP